LFLQAVVAILLQNRSRFVTSIDNANMLCLCIAYSASSLLQHTERNSCVVGLKQQDKQGNIHCCTLVRACSAQPADMVQCTLVLLHALLLLLLLLLT
jgi:hypothetical protein